MKSKNIANLSQTEFNSRIDKDSGVVLVDFGAEWCPPCKALLPTLEQISETFEKHVSVYSVDTDKENALAAQFGIRGLPTVIVFKDGEQVEFLVGRRRYEEYETVLKSYLGSNASKS